MFNFVRVRFPPEYATFGAMDLYQLGGNHRVTRNGRFNRPNEHSDRLNGHSFIHVMNLYKLKANSIVSWL